MYYPNYAVQDDLRRYYEGVPEYIQVSHHKYIQRSVLEHFTMLSVLSWTSATNAAHIYHESMSQLEGPERMNTRYQLRTEHTWDGFVLLALLRDARDNTIVLEVPHTCLQKDRFTGAMRARNERIRQLGQPAYAHYCDRCTRRFEDPDGKTRTFLLCSLVISSSRLCRVC